MYTWVVDFNLKLEGALAEQYLATMIQEWPRLYASAKGTGECLILGNAFGLAGKYSFRLCLDLDSLDSLASLNATYKTEPAWRKALQDWHYYRRDVEAHLLQHETGEAALIRTLKNESGPSYVVVHGVRGVPDAKSFGQVMAAGLGASGRSRGYSLLLTPALRDSYQAWTTLDALSSLDAINQQAATLGTGAAAQLYSVLRTSDGALSGAS